MQVTGLNMTLFVSRKELTNAKQGGSTMIASNIKTKDAVYQVNVPVDACDILDDEVRVNLSMVRKNIEEAGRVMGEAMAAELHKVFAALG
ncbi:hypothetical protein M5X17_26415 [Paenibacillus alvei]|uniref:Uncharacterized protein n=1 Tax=Paenibacillus alvei TaxID=44250 RepID=A0ABT4GZB1_PAEAL|nr:hypothetical protein [Paenibacillus alvei]MCY9539162.1 hypothetical protein [Paenibacillus alvei]MCY9704179.1 hypothetical protein [Paenibacillus alvei]MCY9737252.1 hypothetical protein [Paenibacillus alvei]MCY9762049.1 hypothetical protein [Paenibacillus alvei]MCY9771303.1 hypothetical protein [Paenibacillus alvei]